MDFTINQLIAFLRADYIFSYESERIKNPVVNEDKYALLRQTWQNCYELVDKYKGELSGTDPDFPCSCHIIELKFPTEDDEIILIKEIKGKLADSINNADEVNIDTDIKGNVQIYFGFEDVYTGEV